MFRRRSPEVQARINEAASKACTTHGMTGTKIHRIWLAMRNRCSSPTNRDYHYYGGRGINYSQSWKNFANFYADMGNGYKAGLSLDRIDNNKGYSKENCRWSTRKEQQNNRSNTRRAEFKGEILTFKQIAERLKMPYKTFYLRIKALNWPLEKAIEVPYLARNSKVTRKITREFNLKSI